MARTQSTKRTAIRKKKKKVAPKLVSCRPKKDQSGSESHSPAPKGAIPIIDNNDCDSTPTTKLHNDTVTIVTSLTTHHDDTTVTVATTPTLDDRTQVVPLPTLPEEDNGIHAPPLQLPDTDVIVGDLFTGERTGTTVEQNRISEDIPSNQNASFATPELERNVEKEAVSREVQNVSETQGSR